MKKIVIVALMLSLSSLVLAEEVPALSMDTMADTMEVDESMQLREACYQLISEQKFDEALTKVTAFENSNDKVDIYRSIGMAASDNAIQEKAISGIEAIKSSEEGMDYLDNDIHQIKFYHMTEAEKVSFLKTVNDLSGFLNFLHLGMSAIETPEQAGAIYDHMLALMPESPTAMALIDMLGALSISSDETLIDKQKAIAGTVFEKSKQLETDDQLNISIHLANQFSQENTVYKTHIKTLYENSTALNEKLNIGISICFNKQLNILDDSELAALENETKSNMNQSEEDMGYNFIYHLINLAECQEDFEKMKQLVSTLPESEQAMISIPEMQTME